MNNWQEKSDEELVQLALDNQQIFVILIKRYEEKLLRYIRRICNYSYEDTEDILQEVFIKIYQNLNAFNPQLKFSSWVYRITHNQVISEYRRRKARPAKVAWDMESEIFDNLAADFDIKKIVDNKLLKQDLQQVLAIMEPKYVEVLVLKYWEEKSYAEMSDILQKPEGTVATLLSRAKKQFKKKFHKLQ